MARSDRLTRDRLVRELSEAGCVAAEEEADELIGVATTEAQLSSLVARRVTGEPLACIVGSVHFCGVQVLVHPGVYVPRWQSESLVRRAATRLEHGGLAVDLCTGSGALALALSALAPTARVVGTEIDPVACRCARANGIEVYQGELDGSLVRQLDGTVDVVLGVVPYVPTSELGFLPRDVLEFEPRRALDGGPDGTELLVRALSCAARLLRSGGVVVLELGGAEDELIRPALHDAGFGTVTTIVDEDGDLRGIEAVLDT